MSPSVSVVVGIVVIGLVVWGLVAMPKRATDGCRGVAGR